MAGGPKVLIFILDDAGWDYGCVGHPFAITPAVDWLASNGRVFSNYSVAAPICSASRAAMLTGRTHHFTNVHGADEPTRSERVWMPAGAFTLPRMAKATSANMRTAFFGKWHLGTPAPTRNTLSPMGFGFDYVFGNLYGLPSMPWEDRASYQNAWAFEQNRFVPAQPVMEQTSGFITDVETGRILEKLEEWQDRPLLFWHGLFAPHEPLSTGVSQASLYTGKTIPEQTYYGAISNFDVNLQRVIDKIFELELEGETTIIVTSDNGPVPGIDAEHPYSVGSKGGRYGGKTALWRGGCEVPLIVWGAGVTTGIDTNHRWGLDIFPTIAEIFGFDISGGGYEGLSLLAPAAPRDFFWTMRENSTFFGPQSGNFAMVRTIGDGRRIKMIKWGSESVATNNLDNRFYDISAIPGEPTTLTLVASSPVAGELLQSDADSMVAAFDAWYATRPAFVNNSGEPTQSDFATEAEAVAYLNAELAAYPDEDYGYHCHQCGTTEELDALGVALAAIVGFPNVVPCDHASSVSEVSMGAFERGSNHFFGTSLLVSPRLYRMCLDPTRRSNCTAPQLAEIDRALCKTMSELKGGK